MSIEKTEVEKLISDNMYHHELVAEGTFSGAQSIKAADQAKTKPLRYLVCDSCGKGYEKYLNKIDIFRGDDNKVNNQFWCKRCTIEKPIKENVIKYGEELSFKIIDILKEYFLQELRNKISDAEIIAISQEILDNIDAKIDQKIKEIFDGLK